MLNKIRKKSNKRKYKGSPNKVVEHHISYEPEIKVKILRKEHFIITRLNWFKPPISRGFIKVLRNWIRENKKEAVKLKVGNKI